MAHSPQRFQLLILATSAADAEAVLAVLKRARLQVRGAFSQNPKSLVRASHSDLILACLGESLSAQGIASAYADIDQRIPLIVIAPPGEQDAGALHLLRAGAQGLLTPGDEGSLVRAVQREWNSWNLRQLNANLQARLKRSERHLQALLKVGAERQSLAPKASLPSPDSVPRPDATLPSPQASGQSNLAQEGLMELLSPEYREALGPLLESRRGADPGLQPQGELPEQGGEERAQTPAPELDLTIKPSGERRASIPFDQQASEQEDEPAPGEPLELQPASHPPASHPPASHQVAPNAAKSAELPPLMLATSEEPLPDLSEQPQALSGRQLSDDELIEQIERALKHNGFKLAYQPIVSLRGDSQERYSVLLRLLDDKHSFRAAEDLLEPAARSGRLPEVDRWVIQQAMTKLSERRQAGHRVHFLLSLSAALLQDPELLIWICDQLRQHSIRGNWVSFQIHEQDARSLGDLTHSLANGLRQVKSNLVLSSFGSHPDSELLLSEFPIDIVRLAPSLSENLNADPLKQGHIKHLLSAAHAQGIKSILGCIEDERTLAALWSAGADYVQGKLLGRPSSELELND